MRRPAKFVNHFFQDAVNQTDKEIPMMENVEQGEGAVPAEDDLVTAVHRILSASPHIGVLVVTMFDDDDSVFSAMRAGARGYLLKDADREELLRAISAVHRGEAIFSPAIARRMVQYFATRPGGPARVFPELTEREREILTLMAQGQNNEEIASRLVLSLKTVRNHVSNIFTKLEVSDRVQAVIRAREHGMD